MTALEIIKAALQKLAILNAGQDVSGDDAEFGLAELNRLLGRWNAKPECSYAVTFAPFTLTPSLNPHTIGPSGATWTLAVRPNSIDGASLIVGDTRYPIAIRTHEWYQSLASPELSTAIPTDLYYEPAVSNGKIWLYPVPSAAYEIELWTRSKFAALALTDTFTAPDGYDDALIKTLAEELQVPFRVEMPPYLPQQAREARAVIFNSNVRMPTLCTRDSGLGGGSGYYDHLTGQNR